MKKIKTLLTISLLSLTTMSCDHVPAGTLHDIDGGKNDSIEIYRYYYGEDCWIYISKFKNCKNVVTTTWREQHGKTSVNRGNITIFRYDSLNAVLENKIKELETRLK